MERKVSDPRWESIINALIFSSCCARAASLTQRLTKGAARELRKKKEKRSAHSVWNAILFRAFALIVRTRCILINLIMARRREAGALPRLGAYQSEPETVSREKANYARPKEFSRITAENFARRCFSLSLSLSLSLSSLTRTWPLSSSANDVVH